MIDTEGLHIPLTAKKALLVSDSEWGLDELAGLLTTMGGQPAERLKLPANRKIHPGTYLGAGKLEEVARILEARDLDLLLVDFDLSPSQLRNVEKVVKKLVLDRSGIILEIFNRHARTKEAKLQVEMARLEYIAPRLMHLWSHFERQRGSGGGALKGKGMGEKQIEVDRRMVKDRINLIRRKIDEVEEARALHRRSRSSLLKVAIVGYTNAGKSTLLNALTHSDVLVEDALFATLDATVRLLNPKSRPAVLGIDTVGFIDRLPHGLVASFRSTLGEVLEADLLVHVLDASHPEIKRHLDVTMSVLAELGAVELPDGIDSEEKCPHEPGVGRFSKGWNPALLKNAISDDAAGRPNGTVRTERTLNDVATAATAIKTPKLNIPMLLIFNKMDQCKDASMIKIWAIGLARQYRTEPPLFVSAKNSKDVETVRESVMKFFGRAMETFEVIVPFEDGKTIAQIYEIGNIESRRETEKGLFFRFRTLPEFARQLNLTRYKI